ncbi:MAG: hydantoinase B/oxoprolinase family protein [Acidobacteriota bacterium]|nr:hydantoinase B/oxoprolinase family protein [Acidobacteriota bacterium]
MEIELFARAIGRVAEEMGESLRRTAVSPNIRQRLDYSCAVLDAEGRLLVNAPHIPVHLGSLGLCARAVMAAVALQPGDTVLTNHPAFGGSHLPDLTLISPVFARGRKLAALVASRAHHAEIGGRRPGSMPPDSRHLAEEGVVLPPVLLMRGGRTAWETVRRILAAGPWPSRAVEDNLADLRAALAANLAGVRAIEAVLAQRGPRGFGTCAGNSASGSNGGSDRSWPSAARSRPAPWRSSTTAHGCRSPSRGTATACGWTSAAPEASTGATSMPLQPSSTAWCSTRCACCSPRTCLSTKVCSGWRRSSSKPAVSTRPSPTTPDPAPPWWEATWKSASAWPAACCGPWAWPPPARAR